MGLTKFSINDKIGIKEYYDSYGYVVVTNLLDLAKIQNFLDTYEKIKGSKFFVFFSQDTHLPTQPKLTPEGFIENSMLNPASLKLWHKFSRCTEECLVDESVINALNILSGKSSYVMMQNMFFDKSTGTIEHQDHYYLDSDPSGNMIAAWYALEDIHKDAGCFFVLPGSHKSKVIERNNPANFSDHDSFVKQIQEVIDEEKYEYKSFPLNKGDVLFWHPYTIHGAYNNADPKFSRKSLTAHYHSSDMKALYTNKPEKVRKTVNPNVVTIGSELETYQSNAMYYVKAMANYIRGRGPDYDMRRDSFDTLRSKDTLDS
ncbi:MAG: phytanoyl-CoA dioxygenase family protein [Phormidium sp.]